ncbi:MAG: hypothetical protein H6837_09455 [Planctomycetes bacterium]|nr:hypothetical protein [Planctomycetota bacterium]
MARTSSSLLLALFLVALSACKGDTGPAGLSPDPAPRTIGSADDLPGVVVTVLGLSGGSSADGSFRVGDRISVVFSLKTKGGDELAPSEMTRGAIMVSGPTFNYQRVIASQSDLFTRLERATGGWRYTFADPIPAKYLEPLNYTGRFTDGVLAGTDLLAGTYTVGIEARKDYEVDGTVFRDVGNAHRSFRFGGATELVERTVVANANCNGCHTAIQAHGGNRTEVTNCLLCHTAGAEDGNAPSVAGGTPDVTIDFRVMIHKIHAGKSLPSVQGVSTNPDGSRDYTAAKKKYQVMGFRNSLIDYSDVGFPTWPSFYAGMPRDTGYSLLSADARAKEDAMLSGPVACYKCHGDPDANGPAQAPAQGDLAYTQPSRNACGSCHDDWVWDRPYAANGQTMPASTTPSSCILCHRETGGHLDVRDAHRHPLLDPAIAKGLRVVPSNLHETGANNGNGYLDPGERVAMTFTIQDSTGNAIAPTQVSRVQAVIRGPTANPNMLYNQAIPMAALGAGPTYSINLPELLHLEYVGASTAALDEFATGRAPHWNVAEALTTVYVRTATGGGTLLYQSAARGVNYIDLAVSGGGNFKNGDYIVIDSGVSGKEEYMRVQLVDGDRLWFSSPHTATYKAALTIAHGAGATVAPVTLSAKVLGTDYTLDAATGKITEKVEFGTGAQVVVTYTSDFVVPAEYPGSPNDSPDRDSSSGKWTGLGVVDGTYHLTLSGRIAHSVVRFGETTSYSEGNSAPAYAFVVGMPVPEVATRVDPVTCVRCHDDVQFHGGNHRGYMTCLGCHGSSGAEDRPRYVAANAPATTGLSIEFRTMLHKIHHGRSLANGSTYQVIGFGSGGAGNNFTAHRYDHVGFPDLPNGTKRCVSCHGSVATAWYDLTPREHPMGQLRPTKVWGESCGSCHDSNAAQAHIEANTSPSGGESCAICHGPGKQWAVQDLHKIR